MTTPTPSSTASVPGAPSSRIGYLPGLDGLRAVSVVAVIAYHLEQSWAVGGYLGVEVFFVVSGYLITLLLLDEHQVSGRIHRPAFWMRRAKRLLPAVVALLVGVLTWSALVLGAEALHRFRGEGLASLLYVQNWHAIITDEPYFVSSGRPSPFRHLWSLAIEEQFYLLWPLLLPASLRRHGRRRTAKLALLGAAASVWLMAATSDIAAPERAYYGTDTRAFGILLGCALAFAWRPDRFRAPVRPAARLTLDLAGVAALVVLARQLAQRSEFDPWTFPWGFLLVDAAAIVLIVSCTHPASGFGRVAGCRPLAAIGRRSYSLYLWHWPVVVFTRPGVDWGLEGVPALAVRLVLAVALAELSYRYVEAPFRDGRAQAWLWTVADRANERRLLAPTLVGAALPVLLLVAMVVTAPAPRTEVVAASAPATISIDPLPTTTTTTATTTTTTTAPPAQVATQAAAAPTTTTPPSTTTTAPRPVPDVTIVGESVTLGAAPALQAAYGPRVQIDAVEGRSYNDGIAVIEHLAAAGRLTPNVIIHLGNNGAVPEGGLDRIAAAVGLQRKLILTTVFVDRRWQGQVNDKVLAFVANCDTCALANWHDLVAREPGLTTDDGVHLTDAGERRYVELMLSITG